MPAASRGPTNVDDRHRNEVVLAGRLAAPPEHRELASGGAAVSWRLVLDRPAASQRQSGRRLVDTVTCVTFDASVQVLTRCWQPGELVEACGALRRRFWRSPTGPVSRYEVEVAAARRLGTPFSGGGGECPQHESGSGLGAE